MNRIFLEPFGEAGSGEDSVQSETKKEAPQRHRGEGGGEWLNERGEVWRGMEGRNGGWAL